MKRQKHLLSEIWESYPTLLSKNNEIVFDENLNPYFSDLMIMGPYYHYVIKINNYGIEKVSENIQAIHGLKNIPNHIKNIFELIHPDDIPFVLKAEEVALGKMNEIGPEHYLNLKTSYCFRMKVADDSYHLFHHQAVAIAQDEDLMVTHSLNIHTDINHITQENNKIVLVHGIQKRKDFIQIDLSERQFNEHFQKLSKRELEILPLLANGYSSQKLVKSFIFHLKLCKYIAKTYYTKPIRPIQALLLKNVLRWGYFKQSIRKATRLLLK